MNVLTRAAALPPKVYSFARKSWNRLRSGPTPEKEAVFLLRREEIASGGTALLYRLVYSNGWFEVEKILNPKYQLNAEFEDLQQREFDILSSLDHPLIVKAIRLQARPALLSGETKAVILEHVEGVPLSNLWEFIWTLDPNERRQWAMEAYMQLLSILHHLLERRVIHGDIAPENILVQPNGLLKLIDFGVARFDTDHSLGFKVVGRPMFRAPELRESGLTTFSGDIFAVGKIVEELLGEDVFEKEPELLKIVARLKEKRELPSMPTLLKGWFPGLKPLPPLKDLKQAAIIRSKTVLIREKSMFERLTREQVVAAILACAFPFLTSWLPQRAKITINTLPPSTVMIQALNNRVFYETPVRNLDIPSGLVRVDFVIPSQNNRHIAMEVRASPTEHVKIFEDFEKVDNLKR